MKTTPVLMNGMPLRAVTSGYEFESAPPRRLGDEATITDTASGLRHHVIWLRGAGKTKQWLVDVKQLRLGQETLFRERFPKLFRKHLPKP